MWGLGSWPTISIRSATGCWHTTGDASRHSNTRPSAARCRKKDGNRGRPPSRIDGAVMVEGSHPGQGTNGGREKTLGSPRSGAEERFWNKIPEHAWGKTVFSLRHYLVGMHLAPVLLPTPTYKVLIRGGSDHRFLLYQSVEQFPMRPAKSHEIRSAFRLRTESGIEL